MNTPEDFEQMKRVERAVIAVLKPFRANTHAGLMLLALIRCARVFLRMHSRDEERELLVHITAYLQGKITEPTTAPGRLLSPITRQ